MNRASTPHSARVRLLFSSLVRAPIASRLSLGDRYQNTTSSHSLNSLSLSLHTYGYTDAPTTPLRPASGQN